MGRARRSVLVTFDDGWAEPASLADEFGRWPHLQPVLFLTSRQLVGDAGLLPLPRLYEWCATTGVEFEELAGRGLDRRDLKKLPESQQHARFDRVGVPRLRRSTQVLSLNRVRELMAGGWLVGSHGHDHHDLREDDLSALERGLAEALDAIVQFGGERWLAWPEGRCTERMCDSARRVGFVLQFSLRVEAGSIEREDLVHRDIWS